MQLQLLLVAVALLGHFTLFAGARVVEIARQDNAIDFGAADVYAHPSVEPRMFKKLKTKFKEELEVIKKKKKDKQKAKEGEGDGTTEGEASGTTNTLPPPPKYIGDPPPGMTDGPELEAWNNFIEKDFSAARNPPEDGGYMMYTGEGLRDANFRQPFKDMMEGSGNGKLHDWSDTYRGDPPTEAFMMWADYQKNNQKTQHIAAYAMSWGQARRAANAKPDLAVLYSNKDEPLMKENTYWGAIEAGIITGPDSKVERIWRYNADEIGRDPPPDAVLVWDRSVHEPFGKTDNDWKKNPRDPDVPENAMKEARPLGITPAG